MGFFQEPFNWSAEEAFSPDNWGKTFSSDNVFGSLTGGGVDDVEAPTPSKTEEKITQQQLQALNNGEAFNEALMPYIMESLGYKYGKVTSPDGTSSFNVTKMTWDERKAGLSPQEIQQMEYQDWNMKQTMISQGINPETFKGFASQEDQLAAMTPDMKSQFIRNQAIAKQDMILKGLDPLTGNPLTEDQRQAYMTEAQREEYSLAKQYRDYQKKALAGELPVSPGLERDIATQEGIK